MRPYVDAQTRVDALGDSLHVGLREARDQGRHGEPGQAQAEAERADGRGTEDAGRRGSPISRFSSAASHAPTKSDNDF
jgi:hypothetical protein